MDEILSIVFYIPSIGIKWQAIVAILERLSNEIT